MSFPTELKHRRLLSGTHSLIHTRSLGCWLSRGRPSNLQLCPALPREPSPACPAGPTETNEGLLQHLIHYEESRDRSGKHCQCARLFWTERINWVVVGNCSPAMTLLSITCTGKRTGDGERESASKILFLALVYLSSMCSGSNVLHRMKHHLKLCFHLPAQKARWRVIFPDYTVNRPLQDDLSFLVNL